MYIYKISVPQSTTLTFRPCSNCEGTMRLVGVRSPQGDYNYYSCSMCGDAIEASLAQSASAAAQ